MEKSAPIPNHPTRQVKSYNGLTGEKSPFFKPVIQAKLTVNQPGDEYEQEADTMADKVMRMQQPSSSEPFFLPSPIQRKCSSCEEENKTQLKEASVFVQREDAAAPLKPSPELTLKLSALTQPSSNPDFSGMRQVFFDRNVPHLWDYNSALKVWQFNFDFFKRFGLTPDLSASLSNLTTPLSIDSSLKGDNPTRWDRMDTDMNTSTKGFSLPLLDLNPDFSLAIPSLFKSIFGGSGVQRKSVQEQDIQLQQSNLESPATSSTENYLKSLSGGTLLNNNERSFFESRMGYDFGNVRLHTDSSADQSAYDLNALAYTHGNDIVFKAGQYNSETDTGKRLLAHELTHVVQQNGANENKSIQRLAALDRTTPGNISRPGSTPYGGRRISGNDYTVLTDAGNPVYVWVAYSGLREQDNSWCHGFSFGTYSRWGYSVYSDSVERVLVDEYILVTPGDAVAGDVIAWRGNPDFPHTAILRSIVLQNGQADLDRSLMNSKNGNSPVQLNIPISTMTSQYNNMVEFYRRR